MIGSFVQSPVLPVLPCAKLQVCPPSLSGSQTTAFFGSGSITTPVKTLRPLKNKKVKIVAVKLSDRFTENAIRVLIFSGDMARMLGHDIQCTEHLLLGLITNERGIGAKVLQSKGLNIKDAFEEVVKVSGRKPIKFHWLDKYNIPLSPRAKLVWSNFAKEEAEQLGDGYNIGPDHLLLGLLRDTDGLAAKLLETMGVDASAIRDEVLRMIRERNEAM